MLCGTRSFSHVDEDPLSPPSAPRFSSKKSKNPYSARGLDKFSTVLAELEARRQKIMEQVGSQMSGVAIIRFVYSNTQDWIPIVIKVQDSRLLQEVQKEEKKEKTRKHGGGGAAKSIVPVRQKSDVSKKKDAATEAVAKAEPRVEEKKVVTRRGISSWWKEGQRAVGFSGYWPMAAVAAVVLILLCMALFGRTFAIFCTSIWWYLVPIITGEIVDNGGGGGGARRSMKKRDYERRMSHRKLGSGGEVLVSSPRHHPNVKRGV